MTSSTSLPARVLPATVPGLPKHLRGSALPERPPAVRRRPSRKGSGEARKRTPSPLRSPPPHRRGGRLPDPHAGSALDDEDRELRKREQRLALRKHIANLVRGVRGEKAVDDILADRGNELFAHGPLQEASARWRTPLPRSPAVRRPRPHSAAISLPKSAELVIPGAGEPPEVPPAWKGRKGAADPGAGGGDGALVHASGPAAAAAQQHQVVIKQSPRRGSPGRGRSSPRSRASSPQKKKSTAGLKESSIDQWCRWWNQKGNKLNSITGRIGVLLHALAQGTLPPDMYDFDVERKLEAVPSAEHPAAAPITTQKSETEEELSLGTPAELALIISVLMDDIRRLEKQVRRVESEEGRGQTRISGAEGGAEAYFMLKSMTDDHEREIEARERRIAWLEKELDSCREQVAAVKKEAAASVSSFASPASLPGRTPWDRMNADRVAPVLLKTGAPAPVGRACLMFTGVHDAERLWAQRPEAMAQAMGVHNQVLRNLLRAHGGYEVKCVDGGRFFCAFADAKTAVLCALKLQTELMAQTTWPPELEDDEACAVRYSTGDGARCIWTGLRVRVGLHVGEPICQMDPTTGRMDYFGGCVHVASAVSRSALGGMVAVSADVVTAVGLDAIQAIPGHPCSGCVQHTRLRCTGYDLDVMRLIPAALSEREEDFAPVLRHITEQRRKKRGRKGRPQLTIDIAELQDDGDGEGDEDESPGPQRSMHPSETLDENGYSDSESESTHDDGGNDREEVEAVVVSARLFDWAAVQEQFGAHTGDEWDALLKTFSGCLQRAVEVPWAPPIAVVNAGMGMCDTRAAFFSPAAALRWCLNAQEQLMAAEWPEWLEIASSTQSLKWRGRPVLRGLRLSCGVHQCVISVEPDPMQKGEQTFSSEGALVADRLAHCALGGQVLLTGAVYNAALSASAALASPVLNLVGSHEGHAVYQAYPRHLVGRLFLLMGFDDSDAGRADPSFVAFAQQLAAEEVKRLRAGADLAMSSDDQARLADLMAQVSADADSAELALHAMLPAVDRRALRVGLDKSATVTAPVERIEQWLMAHEDAQMTEHVYADPPLYFALQDVGLIAQCAEVSGYRRGKASARRRGTASGATPRRLISRRAKAFRRAATTAQDSSGSACSSDASSLMSDASGADEFGFEYDLDPTARGSQRKTPSDQRRQRRLTLKRSAVVSNPQQAFKEALAHILQSHQQLRGMCDLLRSYLDQFGGAGDGVVHTTEDDLVSQWVAMCRGGDLAPRQRAAQEFKTMCGFAVDEQEEERNADFRHSSSRVGKSIVGHMSCMVAWAKATGRRWTRNEKISSLGKRRASAYVRSPADPAVSPSVPDAARHGSPAESRRRRGSIMDNRKSAEEPAGLDALPAVRRPRSNTALRPRGQQAPLPSPALEQDDPFKLGSAASGLAIQRTASGRSHSINLGSHTASTLQSGGRPPRRASTLVGTPGHSLGTPKPSGAAMVNIMGQGLIPD
eukprot:TRINITY_DN109_c1_g4_i1.p1 TRINITY_DN109_c1_g4~~TRINITY_DN109_c1_g4_i1.p1  ORF type:complete len:1469 (+),score=315.03 TRINITY_DN109_c1_g4_i1:70-4476(+)